MKNYPVVTLLLLSLFAGNTLHSQEKDSLRLRALTEARYLRSIYKADEAIDRLSGFVTQDRFDEEILSELAECHLQGGNYEDAAGTYFLLSSRFPDKVLYKLKLMQAYYRMKAYPQCIEAGKAALQLDSIPAVASFVADAFRLSEQADSALCYYQKSLSLKPYNETVVAKAANILVSKGDFDGAISQTAPFLDECPDNPVVAPIKGLALYRKGDYDAAIDVFQKQEDLGNDSYPVHYYLGQSYWHAEVVYRAEKELVAAWQIDSSDVNLAYSIAAVKSEARRPFIDNVKPWLDKAYEMVQPDSTLMSRLHQQYGRGYTGSPDSIDKAIAHYKEAYRYNPKFVSALSSIARCYEVRHDYKQALRYYEQYLKLARPGTPAYEYALKSVAVLKAELFMEE